VLGIGLVLGLAMKLEIGVGIESRFWTKLFPVSLVSESPMFLFVVSDC